MDIQRLRNLTTGMLHTEITHVYEDIETITGLPGLRTHQIPNAIIALKPWLLENVTDPRFWDDRFDITHVGDIELPEMTGDERDALLERFDELGLKQALDLIEFIRLNLRHTEEGDSQ